MIKLPKPCGHFEHFYKSVSLYPRSFVEMFEMEIVEKKGTSCRRLGVLVFWMLLSSVTTCNYLVNIATNMPKSNMKHNPKSSRSKVVVLPPTMGYYHLINLFRQLF